MPWLCPVAAVGDEGRDYFLPRPASDMMGFMELAAETSDIAALNLMTLEALRVPKYVDQDGGRWVVGERPLLVGAVALVWTGHLERATLARALPPWGVPRSERDPLGRWCAEGSDT